MNVLKDPKSPRVPDFFSAQVEATRRFYRNLNPDSSESLAVVAGGRERCAAGYQVKREDFPFYSIEFVVGGRGRLVLNHCRYDLQPGTLFAYGPGIPHAIYNDRDERLEKYFLDFSGHQAKGVLMECALLGQVLRSSSPATLLTSFEEITEYGFSHTPFGDQICSNLLRLLVLKISESALTIRDAGSPAFATYQRCRHAINTRYLDVTSLKDIADICHVDTAYMCRLFKRFDQQSPYQHLLRLRMNYAADLLLAPGILVKEVADRLGFDDPFHFSRTFKRVFGVSPTHFGKLKQ